MISDKQVESCPRLLVAPFPPPSLSRTDQSPLWGRPQRWALFTSVTKDSSGALKVSSSGRQDGIRERAPSLGKRDGLPLLRPFGLRGERGTLGWVLSAPFLGVDSLVGRPTPAHIFQWTAEQMLWVKVCAPRASPPGCRDTNQGLDSPCASISKIIK